MDSGQGNALEGSSPEQLIEDALGEESFISALTSASLTWTADEHRAAAHTATAAAEELPRDEEIELAEAEAREWAESPEAWESAVRGVEAMDLYNRGDFHTEAARLLEELGVLSLAELGPPEVATHILTERLTALWG